MLGQALRLLALLPRRPLEFWDRVSAVLDVRFDRFRARPEYPREGWDKVVQSMGELLGGAAQQVLAEPTLAAFKSELAHGIDELRPRAPYPLAACGDVSLGDLCYLVCRLLRPAIVVETGVLYGVTSAFILKALDVNGAGALHSIDLPPLRRDQERYVGCLIPAWLRGRWTLHRGTSRRVLPWLLAGLPPVDVFVHDSLHTYRNMRREFETVEPRLAGRSVVISDDAHGNAAFLEWMRRPGHRYAAAVKEAGKPGLMGVSVR